MWSLKRSLWFVFLLFCVGFVRLELFWNCCLLREGEKLYWYASFCGSEIILDFMNYFRIYESRDSYGGEIFLKLRCFISGITPNLKWSSTFSRIGFCWFFPFKEGRNLCFSIKIYHFFQETNHFGFWWHFSKIVESRIIFLLWLGGILWIILRMKRFSVDLYAVA